VSSDLIIDVTPSEIVIALQENKKLVELTREKAVPGLPLAIFILAR
jgi:ribonuclease G